MMTPINKVVVIGAGIMGAGIAAHLANAGLSVVLLDTAEDGPRRSRRAEEALKRQLAAGGFMHPAFAGRVTPGNVEDDLGLVADADWIVEVIAERLEIKRALFARLEAVRKEGSIVSSNTSTLQLKALIEGQPARFARDFLITHFFNPPRHMRLLELVAGPATRPEAVDAIRRFADVALGKSIVACKDRPGFVANRIGCFWIAAALSEAMTLGLTVEEADAVIGRPFGIPATGVFGLLDLVGLDLMPQVWGSLARDLPADDPLRRFDLDPPIVRSMIERGLVGRKADTGFFRTLEQKGAPARQALDLASGEYRDLRPVSLGSLVTAGNDLHALLCHHDRGGRYAWRVMGPTLAYAVGLVPEITDEPSAVDEAMRLGYAWTRGPFELIDALGPAWLAERLAGESEPVPALLREAAAHGSFYRVADGRRESLRPRGEYRPLRRPSGTLSLADLKMAGKPLAGNRSGSLWDLGDDVACLEFHTKANAIDLHLLAMIEAAVTEVGKGFRALVLGNDAATFSAGADLRAVHEAARRGDWAWIEALVGTGQSTFRGLKFAPFPVVAAVSGAALGGGCEVALHCDAIQAHAETALGLVETKVGLVPAWGGCKELLLRLSSDGDRRSGVGSPGLAAFRTISRACISASALDARDLAYLRPGDGLTMNRDRLLADAKAAALRLAEGYRPPEPRLLALPGLAGRQALLDALGEPTAMHRAAPHDRLVGEMLATVLTGGDADPAQPLPEDEVCELEREAFLTLLRRGETQARIQHLLETGKPFRN